MKFKRLMSLAASAVMLTSTFGIAAAATYPMPFVSDGTADGAVVVGADAAASDWAAAIDLQKDLEAGVTTGTGTTEAAVTGEVYGLFTSSSKIYMNDSINAVKSILTDTELPTVLMDGDFSGNVEADYTQTIKISNNPRVVFSKQPTGDDDPIINVELGTTFTNHAYNLTVTFDRAVNFSNSDSEGEDMTLFGQKVTVGTATDTSNLILYKSADTVSLSIGGTDPNPSEVVTVNGEEYTVELTSATNTAAVIKVTDSTGDSEEKEISEDSTKKVQGIDIAVDIATSSEATSTERAIVIIGAEKIKLSNGNAVKIGSDEDSVDGTQVDFVSTNSPTNITQIVIQISAEDTDVDALVEGGSFVDPVFGTMKLDFAGINIPEGASAREDIAVKNSGNDKMAVTFKDHQGYEKSIDYINNESNAKLADSGGDVINVIEMAQANKTEYLVVGNEDEGYLLEVKTISNDTSTPTDSDIEFEDVFSGDTYRTTVTADGSGTVTVGGRQYSVTYVDSRTVAGDEYVRVNYPDSTTAASQAIIYPTIETGMGAKVAFYEPLTIAFGSWGGTAELTKLRFPDGDGYTDVDFTVHNASTYSIDGGTTNITVGGSDTAAIGQLTYNITCATVNQTTVYLQDVAGANIVDPALIVFEEQDGSTNQLYNAMIVKTDVGGTSADGTGVEDVEFTWGNDAQWDEIQLESDDDLYKSMDYWGTIVTTDRSESDQYTATISYPDEQVYAQLYAAEEAATISPGTVAAGAGGQILVVKDSEVSGVGDKNLVVVGGSCINTVAATMLDSDVPVCGDDFSDLTNVVAGGYLIKVAASPYNADKIAMLVAGYNAEDTTTAVAKVKTGVTTDVDTETVYPVAS